jgi:hypothetical protein
MATALDEIRSLKTQAKNRRDFRRYDSAVQILGRAIGLAKDNLQNPELLYGMAEELADCYALLGGIERRCALEAVSIEVRESHLGQSISAYDKAWEFESDDKYRVVNSYGMVNRLVSRLLLKPESLRVEGETDFGEGVKRLDIRAALRAADRKIAEQLARPRRDDYWAAADLGLVTLLLEQEVVPVAYAGFLAKSPPGYAFKSVLDVLRPLSELNWPLADTFKQATTFLERHAPSSQ